ncbi:hypothetical protein [Sphingomonas sp. ID1715]|uniref:hypothetical protein n=1 Tax=Sphingomonas sp. ID1715 TaxID=1656898 RepID=UPI001C2BE683|nr:hypothetical protein [Sphingomonas sp. ID1715]
MRDSVIQILPCTAGEGDHAKHGGGAGGVAGGATLRFGSGPSTTMLRIAVPLPCEAGEDR